MKTIRRSTGISIALLVYLALMSYIGRGELRNGNYVYYFGVIAVTVACIVLLNVLMRRRERNKK